ncbi:MAG TPA: PaaX family transcriptional regulator C-terminal domain-containing protein [Nocardioidaceae bacterium]|nr:PaaX family transcriptional regulator C-terminal domain-containing protein [Nocardioidaceae bacterium]
MHARSALFDLYGDHLRSRGDRAPVAALVRILAPLEIAAPAVRTAISRMVRQGWLHPARVSNGRGYALTDPARRRLDEAAARIYRTRVPSWDGSWDLLVLDSIGQRSVRERVRSGLGFLGYAALSDSTWIAPEPSSEAQALLAAEGVGHSRFRARDDDPATRARQAWDLDRLGTAYLAWQRFAEDLVSGPTVSHPPAHEEEQSFAVRSQLVHEWRKFLFTDPGLPADLLPADWPGHTAARFFDEQAARLLPPASRFVDRCLTL